jgi:hypothetical protein
MKVKKKIVWLRCRSVCVWNETLAVNHQVSCLVLSCSPRFQPHILEIDYVVDSFRARSVTEHGGGIVSFKPTE